MIILGQNSAKQVGKTTSSDDGSHNLPERSFPTVSCVYANCNFFHY